MSLCPEHTYRSGLTDEEFWLHVFHQEGIADYQVDEPEPTDEDKLAIAEPCPECGSEGACGYDDEGRPMIHALKVEI